MKKTLIALAAVAATGAAFAQSSVTLYGVADVAVGKVGDAGTGLNNYVVQNFGATAAQANQLSLGNNKPQALANGFMNNGSSRWGIKGSEDLGGGLKANFLFEAGVSLATGATSDYNPAATTFGRAAWVGLSGGFGELRAGRQLTTSYASVVTWELTGTANYSVVANQFLYAGAGSRDNATITYTSPSFSGFKVGAGTVLKGNNSDKSKYDMSLGYAAGPLTAAFAYNKTTDADASWNIGGKYNFGTFTVAGSYQNVGITNADDKKGFTVGVSAPVGPVILTADIARATTKAYKNTDFLLEAKYPLSKRTFAYGVVVRDGAVSGGKAVNGYAVGVRHNF